MPFGIHTLHAAHFNHELAAVAHRMAGWVLLVILREPAGHYSSGDWTVGIGFNCPIAERAKRRAQLVHDKKHG